MLKNFTFNLGGPFFLVYPHFKVSRYDKNHNKGYETLSRSLGNQHRNFKYGQAYMGPTT